MEEIIHLPEEQSETGNLTEYTERLTIKSQPRK